MNSKSGIRKMRRSNTLSIETKFKALLSDPPCWTIPSSSLNPDALDAKFYHMNLRQAIKNLKLAGEVKELKKENLAIVIRGQPIDEELQLDDINKIPIIKVGNLSNFGIVWEKIDYTTRLEKNISKPDNALRSVKVNDILIISAGHSPDVIGEKADIVSYMPYKEVTFSPETLLIRVINDCLDPYYLLSFLRSRFGKIQLKMIVRGETAHIYPHDVNRFKVLLLPRDIQSHIGDFLRQAETIRREIQKRKENLLVYQKNFDINISSKCENFVLKRNEISSTTFDAATYLELKKAKEILQKIPYKKKKLSKVATPINVIRRPRPKDFKEKTYSYIQIHDIDQNEGDIISWEEMHGSTAKKRAQRLVRAGDILISTVRPYRGAIAIVPDFLDYSIGTSGFAIFVANENIIKKEVLWFILRTPLLLTQMRGTGGLYPAVSPESLSNITIPIPPLDIQEILSRKIKEIQQLRYGMIFLIMQSQNELESIIEEKIAHSKGEVYSKKQTQKDYAIETFESIINEELNVMQGIKESNTSEMISLNEFIANCRSR